MIQEDAAELKAKELIEKFTNAQYVGCIVCSNSKKYHEDQKYFAKQCAIIAVDEILNNDITVVEIEADNSLVVLNVKFWQKVKTHIINS